MHRFPYSYPPGVGLHFALCFPCIALSIIFVELFLCAIIPFNYFCPWAKSAGTIPSSVHLLVKRGWNQSQLGTIPSHPTDSCLFCVVFCVCFGVFVLFRLLPVYPNPSQLQSIWINPLRIFSWFWDFVCIYVCSFEPLRILTLCWVFVFYACIVDLL